MASPFEFRVEARDARSGARCGLLHTPHGRVRTPAFLPVGTRASVKGVMPDQLARLGAEIVLCNAWHLHLRPGEEVVRALGGLHAFMGWDGPMLTDSGGYQVFSLGHLRAVDDEGATFRSIVDGAPVRLTPEKVVAIERDLGADVAMAFDHCPSTPTERTEVERATERTHRWLERCARAWREAGGVETGQALFGIVQGGAFPDLRRASVEAVVAHDLPGYAVGGVAVGESKEDMRVAVDASLPHLPEDRPRYVMGIGRPEDLFDFVARGADLFDCVTPTRHGRNHQAFTWSGRVNLRNERWSRDERPVDATCDCPCCARFSRAYLRHLAKSDEMLAGILLTLHNLRFFFRLMETMRGAIAEGRFAELAAERAAAMAGRAD